MNSSNSIRKVEHYTYASRAEKVSAETQKILYTIEERLFALEKQNEEYKQRITVLERNLYER
jgi:chaperonin cofactor prefoldin